MILKLRNKEDRNKLLNIFSEKAYNNSFVHEWSKGIHFKANNRFLNIWYDEGYESHFRRGDPIQAHFYGFFIGFFGCYFLVGFRSFNIIMAIVFFVMLYRSLKSFYVIIPAFILTLCIYSSIKDFNDIKIFILNSYNELINQIDI